MDSRTLDGCEADERADGPLGPAALRRWGPGKWGPSRPNSVAARSGAMPVPHAELGQPHNQDGLESDCGVQQTESVEFAEADLHSIPFSHNKGGEMQVSSVLHHLVAVSTELQLGAVFTSHQSLQMGTTKPFCLFNLRFLNFEVLGGDFSPLAMARASVLKNTLTFDICQMPFNEKLSLTSECKDGYSDIVFLQSAPGSHFDRYKKDWENVVMGGLLGNLPEEETLSNLF